MSTRPPSSVDCDAPQLTPAHVNLENEALRLDPNWTKNRKPGLQPVPRSLLERLLAFAAAGFLDKIYRATYARSQSMNLPPKGRLLYVPAHTAAVIYGDMKRAGVDKVTPLGKLDFHALRTAYINFVLRDSTLSPTDMQDMARHGSLDMTKTVYGRARADRMRDAAARISNEICVPCAYPEDEEAERENATPVDTGGCALTKLAPALGLEPRSDLQHNHAETRQNDAKSGQSSALAKSPDTVGEQNSALSQQNPSTSTHEKCVPSVSKNPDLEKVVAAWDDLPDLIKAQILELVKTST